MKQFFLYFASPAVLAFILFGFISLLLDASLREQEFRDNIRFARCERMDDIERNAMKGYCHE